MLKAAFIFVYSPVEISLLFMQIQNPPAAPWKCSLRKFVRRLRCVSHIFCVFGR